MKQQQQHAALLLPPTADVEAPAAVNVEDQRERDRLWNYYFGLAFRASLSLFATGFTVALMMRMSHGSVRLVLVGISIIFGLLLEACIVSDHLYPE